MFWKLKRFRLGQDLNPATHSSYATESLNCVNNSRLHTSMYCCLKTSTAGLPFWFSAHFHESGCSIRQDEGEESISHCIWNIDILALVHLQAKGSSRLRCQKQRDIRQVSVLHIFNGAWSASGISATLNTSPLFLLNLSLSRSGLPAEQYA